MADCSGTDYQMIEFANLFDLKESGVVQAQINSIDAVNNTADLTLITTCDLLDGKDFTSVEFFYHCEYSSGTVEELSFGYKAFEENDIVYVLFSPAVNTTSERLYVIGHVDIKDTKKCGFTLPIACGGHYDTSEEIYVPWETELIVCAPPSSLFINKTPTALMCSRYVNGDERISLIVWQSIEDSSWTVVVERSGGSGGYSLKRETFTPYNNSIHVSAALSYDYSKLYIVLSTLSSGNTIADRYVYEYDQSLATWSTLYSGSFPAPTAVSSTSYYYVLRNGDVGGFLSFTRSPNTVVDSSGTVCGSSVTGYDTSTTTQTYNDLYGGVRNIETLVYTNGYTRWSGIVLIDGENIPVKEALTHTGTRITIQSHVEWDNTTDEKTLEATYNLEGSEPYSVTINGTSYTTSYDAGYTEVWAGRMDGLLEYGVCGEIYCWTATYTIEPYTYMFGKISIKTSGGGWVIESGVYTTKPLAQSEETIIANGDNFVQPCPDLYLWSTQGATETDVDVNKVIYPIEMSIYSMSRSFTSYDEDSDTTYTGALIQETSGGTVEWIVFKNGVDITTEVEACIGHPLGELSAIYWRA